MWRSHGLQHQLLLEGTIQLHYNMGETFQVDSRKKDLQEIMEIFNNNAEKLAPLGSSQANKVLNNRIGSKVPTIRDYSSESNDYRVACAESQECWPLLCNTGWQLLRFAIIKLQCPSGVWEHS